MYVLRICTLLYCTYKQRCIVPCYTVHSCIIILYTCTVHCLLGSYASLLESEPPQSSGGSTAKRYKRDDVLDKVLYSPLSEEFAQWKEKTIREARKALALSPMS